MTSAPDQPIDYGQAELIFERLDQITRDFCRHAGVGEMETVGHLVSYLLDHPRDIAPVLRFGLDELPGDWIERGRLSYRAMNGKITRPHVARRARLIKKLEKSA